ncbi:CCA tRNA nucleotidyltransferase [Lederbergia citrea]|uniref:CCA tRNA nucleotidyltransferase n=1 Tax=Lederbergia citrea TaxID=2833581 RepID=UPI001BC99C1E|nr:CCA tRNA nucleotidyltransferase [Lederbergia citrea]MBS4203145.1 CCA tRNA nucleotidyltransferase [Lederbergia citrea]
MNKVFLAALPVIRKIEDAGFKAYFVGGAVRDFLLEREIHDVDIATSATPFEIKDIFSSTVDVGIDHGTILVLYKGQSFEVTTFRSESNYKDFRRPDTVTFIRSLQEDLKRRDFTINAMAMDAAGNIIDPFNGKADLDHKLIKTVGEAKERFQEDALRLMRAIRFISQLGFSLDKKTHAELANHAHLLEHIAIERISAEMGKLLNGKHNEQALFLALNTNLYSFWPSLFNERELIKSLLELPIRQLNELEMWVLSLYYSNTNQPVDLLKRWKLPVRKIKLILHSLSILNWRLNNKWSDYQLYSSGIDTAIIVERVFKTIQKEPINDIHTEIERRFNELPIVSRSDLAVSGKDLLGWIQKPAGPWMKGLISNIEEAILNKEISNDKMEIRRWVESCQNPSENS